MRCFFRAGLALVIFIALYLVVPVGAWERKDIARLEKTGECFKCDLRGVYLELRYLPEVALGEAYLRGANLRGAFMAHADLEFADLRETNLEGAYLDSANLRGTDLRGAKLHNANLRDADLRGTNFQGADLRGADLQGADLREARHLTQNQIDQGCLDKKTKLPVGLKRPKPCLSELICPHYMFPGICEMK